MSTFLTQKIQFNSSDDLTSYYLNDRTSLRSGWTVSPYYFIRVESADGFYGADIATESFPIPHGIGERSGDVYRKGKGITLSGSIEARNMNDKAVAARYLRQMFWETNPRKLIWNAEDGTQVYFKVRVNNDISIVEVYDSFDAKWTWTVGLRADDPRERKTSDNTLYYSWMT